jgi:para-aminobenzoate synthetase / 4-amino-4-deoxychorismate lyase
MIPLGDRDCFALLDDRAASNENKTSRLYRRFEREHLCVDPAGLDAMWSRVDADLRVGLHAVLLADYEWGAKLLRAGHEGLASDDASALRVLMFGEMTRLSEHEASEWLAAQDVAGAVETPGAAGLMNLEASVDRAAFTDAIERILAAIAAGETYQVNYTYRLHALSFGSPIALYRRLRERQPVSYGTLIRLPLNDDDTQRDDARRDETTHVLSCSPELFLRHERGVLTARPMKGTASRAVGPEGDSETARHLSIDIKNRAENLMIVDLLRNDLGRLAQVGSVKVPELFSIEPYSTVFQMTSTVQAVLKPDVGFADVLCATFPCGSITGAPKHHTMQLIAGLETTTRGLYCGAIGWIDAAVAGSVEQPARCGDFCFSVAIRTLTLGREVNGLRATRLGIGAGIVADSQPQDEFDECWLKAKFVTGLDPGFELFETMLAIPESASTRTGIIQSDDVHSDRHIVVRQLRRHLDRLAQSARVLGFRFDRESARDLVAARIEALRLDPGGDAAWRVRLSLAHDGSVGLRDTPLSPLSDDTVKLLIARHRLPDVNPLSAHKTTLRAAYDEGVRAAEKVGAFDSLFFTEDGRLVEGGRSSVFLRLDGRWYTPPLADGALPGVMRGCLLEDAAWAATERSLTLDDLRRCDSLIVCNALRGVLKAQLVQEIPLPI